MLRCRSAVVVAAALIVATLFVAAPSGASGAVVDTTPPTIRIVTPSSGVTLSTLTVLDAEANDDLGVTAVEYQLTGGEFADDPIGYAAPTMFGWILRWNLAACPGGSCDEQHSVSPPDGTYTLVAVARDAAGNEGRSVEITITIMSKVHIVAPAEGAAVRETTTLVIDTGDLPSVVRVGYIEDLNNFFEATRSTDGRWSAGWKTNALENGSHWIQAQALNGAGEVVGSSAPVEVVTDNDRTAPTSRIVVPFDGAAVSGTKTLAATADDKSPCVYKQECGVGVARVRFVLSGGRDGYRRDLGAAHLTIYGWVLSWDTTSVPADSYRLEAQAWDANENFGSSYGIRVTTTGPARPGVRILSVSPLGAYGSVRGTITLDADAWGAPNVTRVEYRISGNGRSDVLLGVATPTIFGWIYRWNSASFAGAAYDLSAVAYNAAGKTRSGALRILVVPLS